MASAQCPKTATSDNPSMSEEEDPEFALCVGCLLLDKAVEECIGKTPLKSVAWYACVLGPAAGQERPSSLVSWQLILQAPRRTDSFAVIL